MSAAAETPAEPVDNFAAAFDLAMQDEVAAAAGDPPAPAPEPEPAAEPAPEAPEVPASPPEAPAAPETPAPEPAPVEPPAPAAPAEPEKPANEDLLSRLAELVRTPPQAPSAPQDKAPEPEPLPELYSAEEKTFLAEYEKEWPDVAKAERLRRQSEYRDLVGYMFREVAKEIQPLLERVDVLAGRTQLQDLKAEVPEYSEEFRQGVVDWAQKQPTYLQVAYNHVIQQGTVEEVKDLINRYRADTGTRAPAAPAVAAPAPARKPESELPSATKQAVASLAPVSSKRSAASAGAIDPQDFEGAFAAFSDKV